MNASLMDQLRWGRWLAAPAASAMPEPAPRRPGPELVPEPEWEPDPPPPPRRNNGFWALAMFGLGAAAGAWVYLQQSPIADGGGGGGSASFFQTVQATKGDMEESLRVGGSIRAQDFAAIRAPQIRTGRRGGGGSGGGGGLTLIQMAEPGSFVRKGDVVAEFDRQGQQQMIDDQQAGVAQAAAAVKVRQANLMIELETKRQELVTAKAEYEKAKLDVKTSEVKSAIEAEVLKNVMDEAEATFKQLDKEVQLLAASHAAAVRQVEIDLEQEQVDLKRAELNTRYMLIKSPIDGIVVLETIFRGGSFAQVANGDEVYPGSLFMQIVNPASMILEARVNQADSQKVRVGQTARVRLDAYPEQAWEGVVRSVSAMTDSGGSGGGRFRAGSGDYVRQIAVTIDIAGQDARIIPDLSASADILLGEHQNVVIAPREALEQEGDSFFVRLRETAEKAGFVRKRIEVGPMNDTQVVVTNGLEGNETLVVPAAETAELLR
ncbi:MAG: HlyD family efflux transporter periplasmic adaptor subunit [Acidobacteria bacterium]|nr:HlyD family efflux transporter periplasmic adaptor subunit [Acidobacteriota bacterium]